jgi:hypothetical protein
MEVIKNIGLGSIIAFIIYIFVMSISTTIIPNNINSDKYADSAQKIFILNFIIGIFLIFLGNTILKNKNKLRNQAVRYGFLLGGSALMVNSIIMNWDHLDDSTRITLFGLLLFVLIIYSYQRNSTNNMNIDNDNDNYNDDNDYNYKNRVVVHRI